MKNYLIVVFLCFGFLSLSAQTRYYVKQGGSGTKDGTSWLNASDEIQAMINLASSGAEIWVAKGIYLPTRRADNLTAIPRVPSQDFAFVLKEGVKIYGGFAGNETSLLQRNINGNPTILSGLLREYAIIGGFILPEVKTYHVVISAGNVGNACLDGFTIEGGNAKETGYYNVNGSSIPRNSGGGIYLCYSSPTLKNLKIINNSASNHGGGIYAEGSNSSITNVLIANNSATGSSSKGGGIYSIGAYNISHILTNVVISSNSAAYGGGIAVTYVSLTLTNTTIARNYVSSTWDAIYCDNSSLETSTVRNSIIYGNTGSSSKTYGINVTNCHYSLIEGLTAAGTNNNLDGTINPLFVNVSANDYSLSLNSPCIGKGNNSFNSTTTDLAGNPRIRGLNIDLGAYESSNTTKSVSDQRSNDYENILSEESSKIELSVYPNPVNCNEEINISFENYYNPVTVRLYSLDGKLIHNKIYEGGAFKLNVPDLAPGMYIINIYTQEGEAFTKKIIVSK